MERKTRIRLHRSGCPNLRACGRAAAGRRSRPEDPHRQGRIELQDLGRAAFGDVRRLRHQAAHPSRIQGLERPRPDDLHIAGLSKLPLAVSRHEQPARRRTRARDLDGRSLSRVAVVGRRRALFWSGACAGLRNRRHIRLGRFFKRRSAKRRRRVSEIPRTALFVPADVRAGRRTGRSGRCGQSVAGQTRHRPGHGKCRTICGRRFL